LEKLLKGGNTHLPLAASIKIQARARGLLQRKKDRQKRANLEEKPANEQEKPLHSNELEKPLQADSQAKQVTPRSSAVTAAAAPPPAEPQISLESLPKGIHASITKLAKTVADHRRAGADALKKAAAGKAALQQAQGEADALRRRLRGLEDGEERARRALERESARSDGLAHELAAARRAAAGASGELERLQREVVGLRQGRDAAAQALEDKAAYSRRLEAKLLGGTSQQHLAEQNARLRASLEEARRQGEGYRALVEQQRSELHKALREIEVLATALDLRAEELEADGSVRSGLLYQVAAQRHEAAAGQASLQEARAQKKTKKYQTIFVKS
jgi:hypothetical protein